METPRTPGGPPDAPPPQPVTPVTGIPAASSTTATRSSSVVVPPREGPNPWVMLVVGLIIGLIIGGLAGYFIGHGNSTATIRPVATASASVLPTGTPTALPTATATGTAPPTTAGTPTASTTVAQGVQPCPIAVPSGQHALGDPSGPDPGEHSDPSLNFCGAGNATLPQGTTRFTTADNWSVGTAQSCPAGTAGADGMGTVVTITEQLPGGGAGPDTTQLQGDWSYGGSLMAHGGNYQLQVQSLSPNCVWHIAIYTR